MQGSTSFPVYPPPPACGECTRLLGPSSRAALSCIHCGRSISDATSPLAELGEASESPPWLADPAWGADPGAAPAEAWKPADVADGDGSAAPEDDGERPVWGSNKMPATNAVPLGTEIGPRRSRVKMALLGVLVVVALLAGFRATGIDLIPTKVSPGLKLVQGACVQYHVIKRDMFEAGLSGTPSSELKAWYGQNVAVFDEAAQADGKLQPAAEGMHFLADSSKGGDDAAAPGAPAATGVTEAAKHDSSVSRVCADPAILR